jgi:hypothetical protein
MISLILIIDYHLIKIVFCALYLVEKYFLWQVLSVFDKNYQGGLEKII